MIDVALCASGSDEVRIVHGIAHEHADEVRIVRRAADLAETLAVARAGIVDAVLLDLEVRGLDRDVLADILDRGVAVVGLFREAERTDRTTLGLRHVVAVDAEVATIVRALARATGDEDPTLEAADREEGAGEDSAPTPRGPLIAVWGPAGAPGRSTLAANLAHELAVAGRSTVLVDADTYGPCLSQLLGVLEESPGLVAACRASARDTLDAETLERLLPSVLPRLRLLGGIGIPGRWTELRESSLDGVWSALTARGEPVVVDVGFALEEDEEQAFDSLAPRRHAAAITAVRRADVVVAVVTADPVGITRLLRDADRLRELGAPTPHVVINRLASPVPADRVRELVSTRMQTASLHVLPDDPGTCRRAIWDGTMLAESGPRSALRRSVKELSGVVAAAAGVED